VARIVDKSSKVQELQLALQARPAPVLEAKRWLGETDHRAGCQCHRCGWAHGVVAGNINMTFEDWRKR
jgi:hypothetical protein